MKIGLGVGVPMMPRVKKTGGGGGGCYLFDGLDDYMELSSAPITAEPATMMCWFKAANTTTNKSFASIGDAGAVSRLEFGSNATNEDVRITTYGPAGTNAPATAGVGSVIAGAWFHAAGVTAANNSRKAFFNGSAGAPNATTRTLSGLDSILIGARWSTVRGQFMAGHLAHVAVWNIALSDAEVAALAGGALPNTVQAESLVFYAPLNTATPTDVISGNPLTVSGATYDALDGPPV